MSVTEPYHLRPRGKLRSFLQNHYGAEVCQNTAELVESVKELLAKDERIFMKKPMGNPLAAEQICALVLEKLAKKNIV